MKRNDMEIIGNIRKALGLEHDFYRDYGLGMLGKLALAMHPKDSSGRFTNIRTMAGLDSFTVCSVQYRIPLPEDNKVRFTERIKLIDFFLGKAVYILSGKKCLYDARRIRFRYVRNRRTRPVCVDVCFMDEFILVRLSFESFRRKPLI